MRRVDCVEVWTDWSDCRGTPLVKFGGVLYEVHASLKRVVDNADTCAVRNGTLANRASRSTIARIDGERLCYVSPETR